ncbi:hypothetical protein [Kordia jejudonensis]|uniref:hypothetical protein n=1 Tax=Kordia jejudonensis TaxID=1348245 RepID=UPI000629729F|nr:hypothetical protein [Kordia jejudonensis]
MTISKKLITKGFIMAGLMNASVLLFSRFFTNTTIPKYDPEVMSNFGLLMILIWGLAYISVAKTYEHVKWLVAVFALEKLIYGYIWLQWITTSSVAEVYQEDAMAGIFYAIYGVNDWLFCMFFTYVCIRLLKTKND